MSKVVKKRSPKKVIKKSKSVRIAKKDLYRFGITLGVSSGLGLFAVSKLLKSNKNLYTMSKKHAQLADDLKRYQVLSKKKLISLQEVAELIDLKKKLGLV